MSRDPDRSCACRDFNRAALLRRGVAQAGPRPAARSSRACRHRPAPGSRAAASCSPRAGARCCRSTAPGGCSTRPPSRRASRSAAGGRRGAGARQRLPAGRHRLDVGPLPRRRPALPRSTARRSRSPRAPAPRSPRTRACIWHPLAAPLAQLHGEGKVSVMPTIGYTDPEPVALHEPPLLGGRRDPGRPADRLDGPLPRPRRAPPTTRSRASRLDDSLSPALATAKRAGRDDRPALRLLVLGAGRLGTAAGPDVRRLRRARPGRRALAATPAWPSPGQRGADVEHAAPAAAAVPAGRRRQRRRRCRPATRRASDEFPARMAAVAADARAPACRCRASASRPTRCSTPTRARRAPFEAGLGEAAQTLLRLPARPRGARARRPRADARLVGVRPPPAGERLGRHRPRRRRLRAS